MLKLDTLLRKSDALGAYGFRLGCSLELPLTPLTPFERTPFGLDVEGTLVSTGTI